MTALAGTRTLARLALRRDRIRLCVWILLPVGLVTGTASSISSLYADAADRRHYAETAGTNSVFGGPGFGTDTLGGIVVHEVSTVTLILVAVAAIMLMVRHTRTEEETGRAELVGSAAAGRHARLAATLLVVCGTDLVIGALTAVTLIGSGLPASGSFAFGLAVATTGWVFAGVAAVAAQVVEHARTAIGGAAAVFGLAFLLRAVGDANATGGADGAGTGLRHLSWLSPIGWAHRVRAYGGERWWVLGLLVVAAFVLVAAAAVLSVRRDVGAGLVPARLGRSAATPRLSSHWALAWRLQRGNLIGWTIGVTVCAAVLGASAADISDMVGENDDAARVITELGGTGTLTDSYLSWVLRVTGMAAAVYAVIAVLRLRSEETGLRAEPVLATAVKRVHWAAGHIVVAVVGTVTLLVTTGLVVGLVHGLRSADVAHELPRVLAGALVQIPAALTTAAIAIALFGLLPRFTMGVWLFVAGALLIGQLGTVLELDQWAMDVSPFTHLPRLPGGDFSATPLVWLMGLAAALTAAGLFGFRRRDV